MSSHRKSDVKKAAALVVKTPAQACIIRVRKWSNTLSNFM